MSIDDKLWSTTKTLLPPPITDEEMAEMRRIYPLIEHDGRYYRVKDHELIKPRTMSYLWDAKPDGEALVFGALNRITIITFHKFGAPSLFKPSLAEVYACIRAFCSPWNNVQCFCLRSGHLSSANVIGDCHYCICDLFGHPLG